MNNDKPTMDNSQASGLTTYGYDDLKSWPEPEWAVAGMMQAEGLGMIHGEPGTCKTFLMLDLAMSLALDEPFWLGHRVGRRRKVLYVLAEGVQFFSQRMDAWRAKNKNQDYSVLNENLRLYPDAMNILKDDHIDAIIATAKALGSEVVIFDTYSRMMMGKDENSNDVASAAVANLDKVAKSIKGFVWLVHHDNKQGDFRGSTTLNGALDHRIQVAKEGTTGLTLKNPKAKNCSPFPNITADMVDYGPSVVPVLTSVVSWTPNLKVVAAEDTDLGSSIDTNQTMF